MFIQLVGLGIDLTLYVAVRKALQCHENNLKELNNVPAFNIDNNLPKNVEGYTNSQIPYALIQGTVKANKNTLRSFNSSLEGVAQEFVIKEYKTEWKSWSRFWCEVEREIVRQANDVPFSLVKDRCKVEVVDAKSSVALPLATIYTRFTPTETGLTHLILNYLKGEQSRGIQETERMLVEGTLLTGIGKLSLENGKVYLKPPSNNLAYHLTTLTKEELISDLEQDISFLRISKIFLGCVGLGLSAWLIYSWLQKRRVKREKQERLKIINERRRLMEENPRSPSDQANQITCAICLQNPVELTVLPCGHACLCFNCGELITEKCPICRTKFHTLQPVFFP